RQSRSERFPDPARIDEAARLLARAEAPLILVSAAGIDPRAVAGLVEVAEAGGIAIVEADPIYLNASHRHELHLGYNQSGTTNPSRPMPAPLAAVRRTGRCYRTCRSPRQTRGSSIWASTRSSRATRCEAIRATFRSPRHPEWPCRCSRRPCAVTPTVTPSLAD